MSTLATEPAGAGLAAQADLLAGGEFSAAELLDASMARIEAVEPRLPM